MMKNIFLFVLIIWSIGSKANASFHNNKINDNNLSFISADDDSSNYKIKVLKKDINYSQIRFVIVDEKNNPLNGIISLSDVNKKGVTAVLTNEDGKILVSVFTDLVKYIIVGRIGFGDVIIPIDKVKNKVTEVRIQLYPFATTN